MTNVKSSCPFIVTLNEDALLLGIDISVTSLKEEYYN